jgi:cytoskeletal protein CcmA (bactofilin family)
MIKNYSSEGIKPDEITIISNGVKIEGKITSSGNIRVDGEVQGDIISQSSVSVGENGKVNGQINAEAITIGGKVSGTVRAKEKLILDAKADLNGDIFTKILVVESGAKFEGKSKMGNTIDIGDIKDSDKAKNVAVKI